MLGSAAVCLVSMITVWTGAAYIVGEDFRRSREIAVHDTANLARAFEEHSVRSLQAFDQTLLIARDAYLRSGADFDLPRWVIESKFRTDVAINISIADRDGRIIATNVNTTLAAIDVSDREHFRIHAGRAIDDLHISKPLIGRVTGRLSLLLTRRISDPTGAFAGTIMLTVDPAYFTTFYQSVDVGKHGTVQLVGTDGIIRARVAGADRRVGQSVAGARLLEELSERPVGSFVSRGINDGIPRIVSYRLMPEYSLIVVVGQSVDEVFASATGNRTIALTGATLLSILMLAFTIATLRRQQQLNASEFKFRSMFDVSPVGIALIGTAGDIRQTNRAFARLTETVDADLRDRHIDEFLDSTPHGTAAAFGGAAFGGDAEDSTPRECSIRRADGTTSTVLCNSAVASTADALVWLTMQDISERKRAENEIWRSAHFDSLTGLPNRLHLSETLDGMLASGSLPGRPLALLLLDVDHFKVINDTLGHEAGDLVLAKTAARLRRAHVNNGLVARHGGDEFALVVGDVRSERQLMRVARRILRVLRRRIVYRGQSITMSASIGIAVAPRHGAARADLLRSADLALYRAKRLGRNRAVMFEPAMMADAENIYRTVGSFRQAAAENRIVAVYQPQVDLLSGDLVGFEALARVDAGGGRLAPPATFAAALHDPESCRMLGRSMLDQATRDFARWQGIGLSMRIAVNASSFELAHESYAERLIGLLAERHIPCENFEVEITETSVLDDSVPAVARNLGILADHGVRIALDDFGTGYSSLTHLTCLPISRVKIDRSFIADITADPHSRAIVEAIVRLSHSLGKTVIAEGIEHAEQLDQLRELGCDVGQGFIIARPMAAGEVGAFLLRSLTEHGARAAANVFDIGIAAAAR
jgi:diguanylate cyclase (GGDEF)-like protein/PAS domain S-box-containing protein